MQKYPQCTCILSDNKLVAGLSIQRPISDSLPGIPLEILIHVSNAKTINNGTTLFHLNRYSFPSHFATISLQNFQYKWSVYIFKLATILMTEK